MSWLDDNYRFRAPIAIDNSAGGGGTSDVTITIPSDWDLFWSNVQSTGYDIRITTEGGGTAATWQRSSWTYATRTGVIQLDNYTMAASTTAQAWIYWGYASATDASGSFTASSPITGRIFLGAAPPRVVVVSPERIHDVSPRTQLSKLSSEAVYVLWDFRKMLLRRRDPVEGSSVYEEISYVSSVEVQSQGTPQASMVDTTKTRLMDGAVVTWLKAGTSGTTYTAICKVVTTLGQTIEARAKVRVYDVAE